MAGYYGVENLRKIAGGYYFIGMQSFTAEYISQRVQCQRYTAHNLKPAGLLQTPTLATRFEVIAIDLFGPPSLTKVGNKLIFIVEDTASKWVELFMVKTATADACTKIIIEEIIAP